MENDVCLNCERMRRARKLPLDECAWTNHGGRREGAGRKPTTLKGILKRLPKEAAQLIEREARAKAELFYVGIKLGLSTKANVGSESSERASQNSEHSLAENSGEAATCGG